MEIYRQCTQLLDQGQSGVVATLVARSGSGAREVGSKMLITAQGITTGSLGGGTVDTTVIREAQQVLDTGKPVLLTIEPELQGIDRCGSTVQVFLEPLTNGATVFIIGAGHVGRAVAATAGQAGFRTILADDREPQQSDAGLRIVQCQAEDCFRNLTIIDTSLIVICMRSHDLDYTVLQQALATPAPYIGLLGSRRKRTSFFNRLLEAGSTENDLARVVTPAGLAIGARTPGEIGVSIVAQLIEFSHAAASPRSMP